MLERKEKQRLQLFSKKIQMYTMKTIGSLGVGHVGGSLSITDLLAVLYGKEMKYDSRNPQWEERDWLVCSKGHAGPALYSALALMGYFPESELETLNRPGTRLPSHCDRNAAGRQNKHGLPDTGRWGNTGRAGLGDGIVCST